jgi:hypothetical protein
MLRGSLAIALFVAAEAAPQFLRSGSALSLADTSDAASMHSIEVLEEKIRDYKAINPSFSEKTCTSMFETKKKLGGSVPPGDHVVGCGEVCDAAKSMKDYWGTGDMATYACEQVKTFGCVFDGTPPKTGADIGC